MANFLEVSMQTTIEQLSRKGWSIRRIAKELGVNRRTVSKYAKHPAGVFSKCTTASEGVPAGNSWNNQAKCTTPSEGVPAGESTAQPTGQSACLPFHAFIRNALTEGLSAQRIYQDLCSEYAFSNSYDSVKRYVRKLKAITELPFRRMETLPGEEVQIDYGTGYWLEDEAGHRRKAHVLRVTLSFSRKSYSEASLTQDTENFIRCIDTAFRSFGGSVKVIVIDNLKSGVVKPDLYDPELNPKLRDFASYYNCCILPSRVRTPRHKGKVESGIKYVQNNALHGKRFRSLQALNEHLRQWETRVVDQRIHGTVRKQVRVLFEEEKPHLQPLPPMLFEVFHEYKRKVHRDGHVEVCGSYYSVPLEYVHREVWVRYTSRMVRVFDLHMNQIAVHARVERGRFSTRSADIPAEKISNPERGNKWLLSRIDPMGVEVGQWARAMLQNRGVPGTRVLNGLLQLGCKHKYSEMREACKTAQEFGQYYLEAIRKHLAEHSEASQSNLSFTAVHPLIRPVEQYEHIANSKEVFYAQCND